MRLDKKIEEKMKTEALKYLRKAKPKWDVPHALAAVYWMKKLIEGEGGNEKILVTTMYLHDVGYSGLFGKTYNYAQVKENKPLHMVKGAKISEKILKKLNFTQSEIKKIVHLVRIHDKLEKIVSPEEQMVFEADCLAQVDTERFKPTFEKKDYLQCLADFERKRLTKFKTKTGKKYVKKLLEKAKKYFD